MLDIEVLKLAASQLKFKWEDIKDRLKLVIYTDGGAINTPLDACGAGVHGYVYLDDETKSGSKAFVGHVPTKMGYLLKTKGKMAHPNVTVLSYFDIVKPIGAGTNNVAELSAGITGLNLVVDNLSNKEFNFATYTLLSDSEYFIKNYNEYLTGWHDRGYVTGSDKPLANESLWRELFEIRERLGSLGEVKWVKAHNNEAGNDRADYLATCSLNMVINNDFETVIYHEPQKQYGDTTTTINDLLSEKRFFINVEHKDDNLYYQLSMGSRWPGNEEDKRDSVGKRISDTCISVVHLANKEPVIDNLIRFVKSTPNLNGMMYGRLDFLNKGSLHESLNRLGCTILRPDKTQVLIPAPTRIEFLSELNPARLSWRLAQLHEELATTLMDFIVYRDTDPTQLNFDCHDITSQLYLINTDPKVKGYKLYDEDVEVSVAKVTAMIGDEVTEISLTMDVDIPSQASLKKFAKQSPKVYLLTWRDDEFERAVSYATIFQIGDDIGIWMSAYSNVHFLTRKPQ